MVGVATGKGASLPQKPPRPRRSQVAQHAHVGFDAARQRAQVVDALQAADDASLGVALRHVLELLRHPGVVGLHQAELAHVVLAVGVKAGADEDQLRAVRLQPGQPVFGDEFADLRALGVGGHGHVDEVGRLADVALGVERVLVEAAHQNALIPGHDVLGAVAVVDVKVDDGHALQAVALQRVLGGNGHVAQKAKTHGLLARGVVAGRAGGAKGVGNLALQHGVGGVDGRTRRQQRRLPGVFAHRGVGVELDVGRATGADVVGQLGAQAAQRGDVHAVVRQLQLRHRGRVGLAPVQRVAHAGDEQAILDHVQALRGFGVAAAHVVLAAQAVGVVTGGLHVVVFLACFLG